MNMNKFKSASIGYLSLVKGLKEAHKLHLTPQLVLSGTQTPLCSPLRVTSFGQNMVIS